MKGTCVASHACLRAHCPSSSGPAIAALGDATLGLRLADVSLAFRVTRDEEYVHLQLAWSGQTFDLGERNHNYLLLTLARRRLKDAMANRSPASSGWLHTDELAQGLLMSRTQLNTDVFRIRQQFTTIGVLDAGTIIERRQPTGQIRIGVSKATIDFL